MKRSPIGSAAKSLYWGFFSAKASILSKDKEVVRTYMERPGKKKLQLGSGLRVLDGWLNSDYTPRNRQIVRVDATGNYPFPDGTFDYIYTEHMAEHFSYAKGQAMLRECYRVLRNNGKLRISTPDLAFLMDLYRPDKTELQRQYLRWSTEDLSLDTAPSCEDTFVINNYVRDWGHTFIYDEKVLRFCLERAGFTDIRRFGVNKSDDPELRGIENEGRMPEGFLQLESLILEGTRKTS